jgi:molybdopterin molybdotransferase
MSERDVSDLLTVAQAIEIIDATPVTPRIEEVSLAEAQGRILAQDIISDRAYPPFDKSLMDGFAVRSADVAAGPTVLKVIGEIRAGQPATQGIGQGQTVAIMTGAPLPPGADGVVPIEETVTEPDGNIRVVRAGKPQRYIARAGSDLSAGFVVLRSGTRLEAAQLAAAATVGAARLKVFARPRVAVLATGDELVPFDQTPTGAQIRNSNSIMASSLSRNMGCEVIDLGVAVDEPDIIRAKLQQGLQHDALIVSGGMSMGEYDYVPRILLKLGAELRITKLRIKPGKPFIFGTLDRAHVGWASPTTSPTCHIFGLPGNPVSGFVCMARLASRLLTRLAGGVFEERWVSGKLLSPLGPNGPREFYQPVQIRRAVGGEITIEPLTWKGSADLFTLAAANGLLARAENEPALAAGQWVRVLEL